MPDPRPSADSLPGFKEQKSTADELDDKVQEARDQLVRLQREREQIERQKRELEELRRRQNEFEEGRKEMLEQLGRSVGVLEREAYEAQKRHEQLTAVRASFLGHLDALERIIPENWDKDSIAKEVIRALSAVEDARTDYAKNRSKINAVSEQDVIGQDQGEPESDMAEHGMGYWLKAGLCFTMPVVVAVLVLAAILWSRLLPR